MYCSPSHVSNLRAPLLEWRDTFFLICSKAPHVWSLICWQSIVLYRISIPSLPPFLLLPPTICLSLVSLYLFPRKIHSRIIFLTSYLSEFLNSPFFHGIDTAGCQEGERKEDHPVIFTQTNPWMWKRRTAM